MRRILILIVLGVLALVCGYAITAEAAGLPTTFADALLRLAQPQQPTAALPPVGRREHPSKGRRRPLRGADSTLAPDGYQGAERWCEAPVAVPCRVDADCTKVSVPDSRPHKCITPWWADEAERKLKKAQKIKVCAAPYPNRTEKKWRKQRLAAIVEQICVGTSCNEADVTALLSIVAGRESSWRPWKAHRLNGDVEANRTAHLSRARRYGHEQIVQTSSKGKPIPIAVKLTKDGNPYYGDVERWQGWGYYGQNSPLFVALWDDRAPPEILCREIEATETYLERARIAARKQADMGIAPTYATVHYALGSGQLKPKPEALARFIAKAKRRGLDATKPVSASSFGKRLGPTVESRRLAAEILRGQVEAALPWPGRAAGS